MQTNLAGTVQNRNEWQLNMISTTCFDRLCFFFADSALRFYVDISVQFATMGARKHLRYYAITTNRRPLYEQDHRAAVGWQCR